MKFLGALKPLLLIPVISLCGISLFVIASTVPSLFWPQALYFAVGIGLYMVFSLVDYRLWSKFTPLAYVVTLLFLCVSFLGPNIRGSTRWIDFGNFQLQPSEFMKPVFIMIFAALLSRRKLSKLSSLWQPILLFIPIVLLIFKQPDLGNAIVYTTIFLSMLIVGGLPWKYLFAGIIGSAALMPLFWLTLHDYQRQRIFSFISPHNDPAGTGYNALQAMIAIGSGQLYGLGLGRGTQSRLLFLPEFHTDFVFASLGEELGFIGGLLIIICYTLLLGKILHTALDTDDDFGRLAAIGIFSQFFIQIFINIGMNLGTLPITGITLPLVSYGGSSILSTFIALGLIAAVSDIRRKIPLVIR